MNYLSIENLTKVYGEKVLFKDVSFGLNKGDKAALVAKNGTGKTTLLKIISGIEEPESGNVVLRKDLRIGFLPQQPEFDENDTVIEAVFKSGKPIVKAVKEYEAALTHPENQQRLHDAITEMDRLNAWDFDSQVKQILSKLNIHQTESPIALLSGGQKKRVALAKLLIDAPDFLILDEPTNHLDIDMIEWLEEYLSDQNLTILMVTHDRYFLERVCSEIIELERGQLFRYKGNYTYFLEKKEERQEQLLSETDKAKNLFKKELDWIRRGPKARGTKAKSRIDAFDDIKEKAHKDFSEKNVSIDIQVSRLGGKILELHNINKSYGGLKLITNFTYKFKKFERIGVVGKNGAGKSTFLNLLTGSSSPDNGKIVKGETVVFGYYNQEGITIKEDLRVIEAVRDVAEYIPLAKGKTLTAAQLLERFLFPPETQYSLVSKLSGGEKRRLYLLTVIMKNPNFLILDEPTNDLDVMTLQVLEEFLEDFQGCLIIVSHDRYFMDKLVDHLFIFENGGNIKDYNGNYQDYRREQASLEKEIRKTEFKKDTPPPPQNKDKVKLSYKEKIEFEKLEKEIPELEKRKAELTQNLNSGETDYTKLQQWSAELEKINEELDAKSERWLELSEFT